MLEPSTGSSDLQQLVLPGEASSSTRRIDTHHHIIPSFYAEAVESAGGDPSGYYVPSWSLTEAREGITFLGVETAIISVSAPGATIFEGDKSRQLARELNEFCASLSREEPSRFGFFASLPQLTDVEGTLAEIEYALNVLKADGVVAFTSYVQDGNHLYLGHPLLKPIWDLLDSYSAVVFVHPNKAPTTQVNRILTQPAIDYPHETTRTASDLVLMSTVKDHPNIKFILSHAGGTLPFLADRVALLSLNPRVKCPVSYEELLAGFRSFYYDTALSTSPGQLKALLEIASPDRILFGSDFPYAIPRVGKLAADKLESFCASLGDLGVLQRKINRENAIKLFPQRFNLPQTS